MNLQEKYNIVILEYIHEFSVKQELLFTDWVDEIGGNADFNSYVFFFGDIKYDIDEKIDKGLIFKYYDFCVEEYSKNKKGVPNYKNWLKLKH